MFKDSDYNFDLIVSHEILRKNQEKILDKDFKENRKKHFINVGSVVVILIVLCSILSIIMLLNYTNLEMERHIEKKSQECSIQGYGIGARYTKDGEKYYVCNK